MSFTLEGVLLSGTHASRPAANATGLGVGSLYSCTDHNLVYQTDGSSWSTWATLGSAASGSITASGYTMSTARLLGRTTASSGAVEEISVGTGLSLAAGSLSATGGGGDFSFIDEQVLGSDAANITITGIPNTYRDLLLVAQCRGTNAGNDWANLRLQMGDGSIDTGNNYGHAYTQFGTGSAGGNNTAGEASGMISNIPSATSTTGARSATVVHILGYANTSYFKTWTGLGSGFGASDNYSWIVGGVYRSTSAEVDQVRVFCPTGNLKTGSRLALYGLG